MGDLNPSHLEHSKIGHLYQHTASREDGISSAM
jgi:hypothetical protein